MSAAICLPHVYKGGVKKEIELLMLKQGIIEPASSEWALPIVIIKKVDTIRLCVDYPRLNAMTQFDAYPMPRIDDILDQVGQGRYITILDLAKGYWLVPVAEEDHPKTAFITPRGLYQFKIMPFGLCGSPQCFSE